MIRRHPVVLTARKAWPYAVMAWKRWQDLPEEEKERYRQRARDYAKKGGEYAKKGGEYAKRGGEAVRKRRGR